ncbi:MAG: NAD-dependent malic enzyme [Gammaproteobacteria bacterium]|nr:NAD-dependent malic enzyme [Gammaproteobacteria bacterium]
MHRYQMRTDPDTGERFVAVSRRGRALLNDSMLNKGTAFTMEERMDFGIDGLLPPAILTIEQQLDRIYENYQRQTNDLDRYLYLAALQDRNETLFYRLLSGHVEEMTPIVYTPTVGLACQNFSHIYRKPRGLYITQAHAGRMRQVLNEAPFFGVHAIVATDSEGILGLGDLGCGGMGIPIGKLSLYTLGGGIHPARCLPVCLDVGTNNAQLRADPLYLGVQKPRLQGDEYYALLDEFVDAVAEVFPEALLQWEDFSRQKAWTVLERYRHRVCSFNDDIQGTGAITLAGVHGVCKITGRSLADHRFVVHGAGAGGGGIMHVLLAALEDAGLDAKEARNRVLGVDSRGLILSDRNGLEDFKKALAADPALVADWKVVNPNSHYLDDVVANFKPTVLIGTSGQAGSFTEALVREMAAHVDRPALFALSNPTSKTEVHPADALAWSEGRALVATGSPFDDVVHEGVTHRIGQGNNVFCFPGIGLGAIASGARLVTDGMLLAAARAVAEQVPESDLQSGCVYPEVYNLRPVSLAVAEAVANAAISEGVTEEEKDEGDSRTIAERVAAHVWHPEYLPYRYEAESWADRT